MPRIQAETWEEGAYRNALFAVAGSGGAEAFGVRCRPDGGWRVGVGSLGGLSGPCDPSDAFRRVGFRTATANDIDGLGAFGGEAFLTDRLLDVMFGEPRDRDDDDSLFSAMIGDPLDWALEDMDGLGPPDPLAGQQYGFPPEAFGDIAWGHDVPTFLDRPRPLRPGPGEVVSFRGRDREVARASVDGFVRSAVAWLAGPEDRAAFALLGKGRWSHGAHGHFAAAGVAGDRRRQAAGLYPALAPTLAAAVEVAAVVDAGRPFEDALLRALSPLARGRGEMSPAALRRLRTLPPQGDFDQMKVAVALASGLPVDWLPDTAEGWERTLGLAGALVEPAGRLNVGLSGLVHHASGDWDRALRDLAGSAPGGPRGRPPERLGARILDHAYDVARRLSDTLVSQARESLGLSGDARGDRMIAGAVLFEGRSLPAVNRIQSDWHRGVSRLSAALARGTGNAWPAAFPPFRAPNGLAVTCLTDEGQLADEGGNGPDADGVDGLQHCVGGYGRECFTGSCVIASVRAGTERDAPRLSTVQFVPVAQPGFRGREETHRGQIRVAQHQGFRNATVGVAEREAVAALIGALGTGAHPYDPAALLPRCDAGYRTGLDWREPGAMERAFEAWRPYLPREIARGGLPALRLRVAQEHARLSPATRGEQAR